MKHLRIFFSLIFILILNLTNAQNWYNQTYTIQFSNVTSNELLKDFSFYAVQGSRTDDYSVTIDKINATIQFSFITMGGEDATLIIENGNKKMVILYGNYYPSVSRATSQSETYGFFIPGYYTSFDNRFLKLKEEYKDSWHIVHQNHDPIVISVIP